MMVRRDEAGHDDRARAVDHFGIAGGKVGSDGAIFLPSIRTSAFSKSPTFGSSRQHDAAAQQDPAFSAVPDQTARVGIGG